VLFEFSKRLYHFRKTNLTKRTFEKNHDREQNFANFINHTHDFVRILHEQKFSDFPKITKCRNVSKNLLKFRRKLPECVAQICFKE